MDLKKVNLNRDWAGEVRFEPLTGTSVSFKSCIEGKVLNLNPNIPKSGAKKSNEIGSQAYSISQSRLRFGYVECYLRHLKTSNYVIYDPCNGPVLYRGHPILPMIEAFNLTLQETDLVRVAVSINNFTLSLFLNRSELFFPFKTIFYFITFSSLIAQQSAP
jgi:hypothetical protein